jgi:hypothetical protein
VTFWVNANKAGWHLKRSRAIRAPAGWKKRVEE